MLGTLSPRSLTEAVKERSMDASVGTRWSVRAVPPAWGMCRAWTFPVLSGGDFMSFFDGKLKGDRLTGHVNPDRKDKKPEHHRDALAKKKPAGCSAGLVR